MRLRDVLSTDLATRYEVLAEAPKPMEIRELQRYALWHVLIGSTPREEGEWDTPDGKIRNWITSLPFSL